MQNSEFGSEKVQNLLVTCENIMDMPQNQDFTILTVYLNCLILTTGQLNQVSGKGAKALTFAKSEASEYESHHKWMHFSDFHLCFESGSPSACDSVRQGRAG